MESGWRYARFFFKDTVKRIGTVTQYAQHRYPDLFDGNKNGRRNTPSASPAYITGRNIEDREKQLCSICDYDTDKIDKLKRAPIIDFYMILNARVEQANKINKK